MMQLYYIDCFTCSNSIKDVGKYKCLVKKKQINVATYKPCSKWSSPPSDFLQNKRFYTTIVVVKSCFNCQYYGTKCINVDFIRGPACSYTDWKLDDDMLQELVK